VDGTGTSVAMLRLESGRRINMDGDSHLIDADVLLCCASDGAIIPFAKTPSADSSAWWHFTTEADFAAPPSRGFSVLDSPEKPYIPPPRPDAPPPPPDTPPPPPPQEGLTRIVVHGPEWRLNDDFYFVQPGREIPTDHYLASFPPNLPIAAGFDANGNRVLGQSRIEAAGSAAAYEVSVDGMNLAADVWVGRAPVTTAVEARNFIEKVIQYETLRRANGGVVDPKTAAKTVYLADDWVQPWDHTQIPDKFRDTSHPAPGCFSRWEEGLRIMISNEGDSKLADIFAMKDATGAFPYRCRLLTGEEELVVPYLYDPSNNSGTGWFFCDISWRPIQIVSGTLGTPRVRTNLDLEKEPEFVFWDEIQVDSAAQQKEHTRSIIRGIFPEFRDEVRLYRDHIDVSQSDGPVQPFSEGLILTALNAGAHLLSMSGHGNVDGINGFKSIVSASVELTNTDARFITFAHSCLTSRPDNSSVPRSFGDRLVTMQNGAVAYVGYTRDCWTGDEGAGQEQFFWCALERFGRLGPAAGLHLTITGIPRFQINLAQALYGDPEMPVWTGTPTYYEVGLPDKAPRGHFLPVWVGQGGAALAGQVVTILAGWIGSAAPPELFYSTTTSADGTARLPVPTWLRATTVRVTVCPPSAPPRQNFVPFTRELPVPKISIE
jgi:hypothetical protein